MPNTESTTKFRADISQLKTAMQQAQREVKLANAQFKAASSSMDDWSKTADGLQAKIKQLTTVQSAQRKQLSLLERELEMTVKEYGENSKEADNLRIRIENQKAALNTTTKELGKYEKELDNAGKEVDTLGNESQETTKQVDKMSDGFTVAKGALADLVASGIKAAISGLKDLAKFAKEAYAEFDKGADAVIKATGATGEAADELTENYKNVAHNVVGDMDAIGSALGEVNTRFGFTGDELESATEAFMKFSDITGTDATDAVKLVSRAMENAGMDAKDYKKLLDILAKAGQSTGVSVDSLAEAVTKNGATFRQLGYTTEEAVAMLAKFEKEGVNSETVLVGMKTAVKNWGKEGKNAKEEYKKALDEIAKTEDITKATAKAIEVFGSKAGPELVEDIQKGKLEYNDFLEVLKKSEGTVTDTYEATQDGFNKITLAIQGGKADLGSFVRELATEYQDQIVGFIGKVKNWIQKAIKWVVQNGGIIIETVKSIAKVLATIWAVKKAAAFATAINGVITAIKGMATAASAASAATGALNGAGGILSALVSPGGAIVMGIAAIATVTATIIRLTKEEARELNTLTDEQQKSIEKSEALKVSYDNLETARRQSMSSVQTEWQRIEDLKGEMDSLVGANGKVKEGYETRVSYILHELNEATGQEMKMIDGVIENYAKERQEIDELIEKKKAQAILDANQDAYMQAYGKRVEATNTYVEAQKTFNEVLAATEEKQKEVADIMDNVTMINYAEGADAARAYAEAHAEVLAEYEKMKESVNDSRVALEQATSAYEGYNQIIENYEGLSSAVIEGDSAKIEEALIKVENGMKTHTKTTTDELKKQKDEREKYYKDLIQLQKEGDKSITNGMIEDAKKMFELAEKEWKQGGVNEVAGYIKGISEKEDQALLLIKQLGYDSVADFNEALGIKSPSKKTAQSGEYFAEGFISGMSNKESAVYKKAQELAKKAIQGLKDGQKEGSPSKITTQSGKYFTEGYMRGISSEQDELVKEVKELVMEAVDALGGRELMAKAKAGMEGIMKEAGQGLAIDAAAVRSVMPTARPAGASQTVNNYNLVQNNTSPKALSALDTYRARQQQISLIKAIT